MLPTLRAGAKRPLQSRQNSWVAELAQGGLLGGQSVDTGLEDVLVATILFALSLWSLPANQVS